MSQQNGNKEHTQIPTTGMRGGLGKTLLTAFLVMTIVPLASITWYATQRERHDIQREVTAKLSSVVEVMEIHTQQWIAYHTDELALLATMPAWQEHLTILVANPQSDAASRSEAYETFSHQLRTLIDHDPSFYQLAIFDDQEQPLISITQSLPVNPSIDQDACLQAIAPGTATESQLAIQSPILDPEDGRELGKVVGWLNPCYLVKTIASLQGLGKTGTIYLVDSHYVALPWGETVTSAGIEMALNGINTEGLYINYAGVPVIGIYRWMPELGMVLVAEQTQGEAFASNDNVVAAVIGAMLLAALVTAVIAAIVTRQITRPIVLLTESALALAQGELEHRVPMHRFARDEIGILAYVFNQMATELKSLYDDLEEKVAQRTALLQKANYQIQRRAIQLATIVQVSQAATSILDPEQLLRQVVHLLHDSFYSYNYVGIYLLDEKTKPPTLLHQESAGGREALVNLKRQPVQLDDETPIGRAARTGQPSILQWDPQQAECLFNIPYICAEAALPLKIGDKIIGVLNILSTEEGDFTPDDVSVLQNVANQITIALENARLYITEREAARRLRELDQSKRRFLANMSHELRTPLTNIIGFSRLMLKGLSDPLTEQQRADIQIIYQNGRHLLGLINDLLDLSHIEAGMVELELRTVDLTELIHSVMATTSALVRDKEIELIVEVPDDIPPVQADPVRIRQVLLRLLANAAKFTEQGAITIRSWRSDGMVLVSVSDTGVGISPDDHDRIFEQFEQGKLGNGRRPNGAGLGLALSKEFVEMHGGRIWVESEPGVGSTFTFSLPLSAPDDRSNEGK